MTRVQNPFDFIGPAQGAINTSLQFISDNVLAFDTPTKEALQLTQSVFHTGSSENTTKICILLSDGAATTGSPTNAASLLSQTGVTIHTIYFAGRDEGRAELEAIAMAGGGVASNADDQIGLDQAFSQILSSLGISLVE